MTTGHFMHKAEILQLMRSVSSRQIQNHNIWQELLYGLSQQLNSGSLTLKELMQVTFDLYNIHLQSEELF